MLHFLKWHNPHRRYSSYDSCRWHSRYTFAPTAKGGLWTSRDESSAARNLSMGGRLALGIATALSLLTAGGLYAQGPGPAPGMQAVAPNAYAGPGGYAPAGYGQAAYGPSHGQPVSQSVWRLSSAGVRAPVLRPAVLWSADRRSGGLRSRESKRSPVPSGMPLGLQRNARMWERRSER